MITKSNGFSKITGLFGLLIGTIFLATVFSSCKSEYDQYARKELGSGIRQDSLLFGMTMGQTKKEFYAICWELNSQKKISPGSGNRYARYTQPIEELEVLEDRIQFDFFGIFDDDDVMRGMDMIVQFTSWAIWNENRHAKELVKFMEKKILKEYGGNEFIDVNLPKVDLARVKIDGNRQFLIYPIDTRDIQIRIEDLDFKLNQK